MSVLSRSLALLGVVVAAGASAGQPRPVTPETLDVLFTAHAAACASIRACSCKTEVVQDSSSRGGPVVKMESDYLRSGDAVRVRLREDRGASDIVYRDSIIRSFSQSKRPNGQIHKVTDYPHLNGDPWSGGLLVLPIPNEATFVSLPGLVKIASKTSKPERRADGGASFVCLDLKFKAGPKVHEKDWDMTLWFDPVVKYLVRRVTLESAGAKVRRDLRVLKFEEPASGVFFPVHAEIQVTRDGKPAYQETTTTTALRVNQPVPKDAFDLTFPAGVVVIDSIRNVTYWSDGKGGSAGPALPPGKTGG
jgi:hypothetical protein